MADSIWPHGVQNYWKSNFLAEVSDEAIDTILAKFATVPSPLTTVVIDHNGDGAMNRVSPDATAFGQRDWSYNLLITSLWTDPADSDVNIRWTRALWAAMEPFTREGVYVNYLGAEGQDRVRSAYGPTTTGWSTSRTRTTRPMSSASTRTSHRPGTSGRLRPQRDEGPWKPPLRSGP